MKPIKTALVGWVLFLTQLIWIASAQGALLYWSEFRPDTISRANRDGTNAETIYTSPLVQPSSNGVHGIDLDLVNEKIYWVEDDETIFGPTGPSIGLIKRSNFDGSSVETVVTTDYSQQLINSIPRDIEVDAIGGHIYWTDNTDFGNQGLIYRADLDGANVQLIAIDFKPDSIELDLEMGKIYWADSSDREIVRMDLNGLNRETVLNTSFRPFGLAVDPVGEHFYYSDNDTANGVARIRRANLDGTGESIIIGPGAGLEDIRDLAVDPDEGKIYWANFGAQKIQRANLDGTNIEDLLTNLDSPARLALDSPVPLVEPPPPPPPDRFLFYDPFDGSLTIDTDGTDIDSYVFDSASGIFTVAPPNFIGGTIFTQDSDFRISENFFSPALNGLHDVGPVALAGLTKAFLLADLSLRGGLAGDPNFNFILRVAPEPSSYILCALLATLAIPCARWRRRRAA